MTTVGEIIEDIKEADDGQPYMTEIVNYFEVSREELEEDP